MDMNNFDATMSDATETDAETLTTLEDINTNILDIKYCVMLFFLLWVVITCKKMIHTALRLYIDK